MPPNLTPVWADARLARGYRSVNYKPLNTSYLNGKNAVMVLFKKKMTAWEEIDIPQECWAGAKVLLPAQ